MYTCPLEPIIKVIEQAVSHLNRFVREISYFVIQATLKASAKILTEGSEKQIEYFKETSAKLTNIIARGLADNWSQVRYAASLSVRELYNVI